MQSFAQNSKTPVKFQINSRKLSLKNDQFKRTLKKETHHKKKTALNYGDLSTSEDSSKLKDSHSNQNLLKNQFEKNSCTEVKDKSFKASSDTTTFRIPNKALFADEEDKKLDTRVDDPIENKDKYDPFFDDDDDNNTSKITPKNSPSHPQTAKVDDNEKSEKTSPKASSPNTIVQYPLHMLNSTKETHDGKISDKKDHKKHSSSKSDETKFKEKSKHSKDHDKKNRKSHKENYDNDNYSDKSKSKYKDKYNDDYDDYYYKKSSYNHYDDENHDKDHYSHHKHADRYESIKFHKVAKSYRNRSRSNSSDRYDSHGYYSKESRHKSPSPEVHRRYLDDRHENGSYSKRRHRKYEKDHHDYNDHRLHDRKYDKGYQKSRHKLLSVSPESDSRKEYRRDRTYHHRHRSKEKSSSSSSVMLLDNDLEDTTISINDNSFSPKSHQYSSSFNKNRSSEYSKKHQKVLNKSFDIVLDEIPLPGSNGDIDVKGKVSDGRNKLNEVSVSKRGYDLDDIPIPVSNDTKHHKDKNKIYEKDCEISSHTDSNKKLYKQENISKNKLKNEINSKNSHSNHIKFNDTPKKDSKIVFSMKDSNKLKAFHNQKQAIFEEESDNEKESKTSPSKVSQSTISTTPSISTSFLPIIPKTDKTKDLLKDLRKDEIYDPIGESSPPKVEIKSIPNQVHQSGNKLPVKNLCDTRSQEKSETKQTVSFDSSSLISSTFYPTLSNTDKCVSETFSNTDLHIDLLTIRKKVLNDLIKSNVAEPTITKNTNHSIPPQTNVLHIKEEEKHSKINKETPMHKEETTIKPKEKRRSRFGDPVKHPKPHKTTQDIPPTTSTQSISTNFSQSTLIDSTSNVSCNINENFDSKLLEVESSLNMKSKEVSDIPLDVSEQNNEEISMDIEESFENECTEEVIKDNSPSEVKVTKEDNTVQTPVSNESLINVVINEVNATPLTQSTLPSTTLTTDVPTMHTTTISAGDTNENLQDISTMCVSSKSDTENIPNVNYSKSLENINFASKGTPNTFNNCPNIKMKIKMQCVWNSVSACDQLSQFDYSNLNKTVGVEIKKVEEVMDSSPTKPINETPVSKNITSNIINDTPSIPLGQSSISTPTTKSTEIVEKKGKNEGGKGGRKSNKDANEAGKKVERRRSSRIKSKQDNKMKENKIQEYKNSIQNNSFYLKNKGSKISDLITIINNEKENTVNTTTNQSFIPPKEAPTTPTVREETKGESYKPEKVKSRWRRWSELESDESSSQSQTSKPPPLSLQTASNDDKSFDAPILTDAIPEAKNDADTKEKDEVKVDEAKEDEDDDLNAKPTPYISIEENLYLSERDIKKQKKESRRMVCDCELREVSEGVIDPSSACGAECLNRMLMIECGSRCPCKEFCNNRQFTQMRYAKTKCFRTPWKGWGLQADEDMPIGTFIMEYVGEVLEYKEFKSRTKRYNKENIQHHYFMALNVEQVIDATKKGNASRFINHCCDPNAETQKWTVNGQLRVGFFVVKPIKKGEEITFNYQFESYGEEKIKCYCGSSKCTGFIGGNKNTPFKLRKSSKTKKKKIIELFSDLHLEREVEAMTSLGGLRRKQHVLELNRIMLRADNVEHRLALLKVLQNTKEPACLRLFLDYHGLSLLWSWMVGGHADDGFRKQIIETLKLLPINNRTCLKNSKVLSVIEKWASTTNETAITNTNIPATSVIDINASAANTTTISTAERNTSAVTSSINASVTSSTIPQKTSLPDIKATKDQPITSDQVDDVTTNDATTVSKNNDKNDASVDENNDNGDRNNNGNGDDNSMSDINGGRESMEVDDDCGGSKKGGIDAVCEDDDANHRKDVDNNNNNQDNDNKVNNNKENNNTNKQEIDNKDDENKDTLDSPTEENASNNVAKVTGGKEGEDDESGVDNDDEGGKEKHDEDNVNDCDENKDNDEKDKDSRENKNEIENNQSSMAVDKDTDKDTNSKTHTDMQTDQPTKEEGNDEDGKEDDVSVKDEMVDIVSMANSLLDAWRDLKEGFKIPKMKVEERKKTELELDEQCDNRRNSKGWDKGVLKRSLEEFGLSNHESIKIKKKKINETDKNKNKTSVSSSSSDNLIKLEHRQQFEAKVRAEEMEKAAKQQHQLQQQLLKQQFLANQPTLFQSPIMPDNKPQSFPISTIIKNHQHMVNTTSAEAYKQEQYYIPSIASNSLQPQPPFISPMVEAPFMSTAISTTTNNNINTFNNFNNNLPCFINYPPVDDYNMSHHLQEMPQQSMYPLQPYSVPQQPPYNHFMPPNDMSYNNSNNSNDNSINKTNMFSPINRNVNPAVNSKNIKVIDLQEPPPPPSTPPKQLPPHWKSAKDSSGKVYYYHAITRKTQWDPPTWDAASNQNTLREVKPHQATPTQKKQSTTTTAAADTSSSAEVVKRKRDVFKEKVSKVVISCLNPYRKPECSKARICSNDDFKYLARKLTHAVLMKEEKCCKQAQNLEYNDSVKLKAKDYIHKYMTKFSDVYTRTGSEVVEKVKKSDYASKEDESKRSIRSLKDPS